MKNKICLALVFVLIFGLCACEYKPTNNDSLTPSPTQNILNENEVIVNSKPSLTNNNSHMEVHFIDVGQADAALIINNGETMLIDGGNREDSDLIYTYLKNNNISHLNYVVGTHAHEDHIGGIPGALEYATVDTVLSPVTDYDSKVWDNFEKYANNRNSEITVPSVGDTFALGDAEVVVLACNPEADTNNTSIVLRINHGENSFLFTGDAEEEVEKGILDNGLDIDVDVLKVGHHGSNTSSCYQFLKAVSPKYSVISCGVDNSYGHPHEETMSRLRDVDTKVFRTDIQGTIICYSDGETLSFSVEKNPDADTIQLSPNSTQKKTNDNTTYILNTSSLKFHRESCSSVEKIGEKNREAFTGNRNELIDMGYKPCKSCQP